MDDLSLRAEFHRALDPIAPPAPWLAAAVREGLRQRRPTLPQDRRGQSRGLAGPGWLLPAVAILLAVAIALAIVVGSGLLRFNRIIPVRPQQHGLAAPIGCPGWTANSSGGLTEASDRMTSTSVGWANGALRTDDGGAHWQRLAPDEMLSDAPKGTDARAYPPAYADYFLDSQHGWLAYGYPSAAACFDHVTVFATSDGGQSWQRSHAVNAAIRADSSLQLQLDFIDARHGWLLVLAGGRLAPDWFVYTTVNGGQDWQLLSPMQLMSSWCSVHFISAAIGFLGQCMNTSGPSPQLAYTRDGGMTWGTLTLPAPIGNQFTVSAPVFFNQAQGIVHVYAQTFQGNTETSGDYLAATEDGGRTWRALPPLSIPGYAQGFAFLDRTHFLAVVSDGKGVSEAVYRTADGGLTWSAGGSLAPMFQTYPEVMFVDRQHGFIDEPSQKVGEGPLAFFASGDGGRTWQDRHPQVS